jgi:hypothetical protein
MSMSLDRTLNVVLIILDGVPFKMQPKQVTYYGKEMKEDAVPRIMDSSSCPHDIRIDAVLVARLLLLSPVAQ